MAPATINPSKFSLPLGLRLPKSMTLYLETLLLNGAFSWPLTYKVFEKLSLEKIRVPILLWCRCKLWRTLSVGQGPLHTGSLWLDLFQNSRNIVFAKIWHFLALVTLKDTKKTIKYWKRPTKAVKVILEARESKNGKILILLHFCDHLVSKMMRIQYFDVSRS